MELVQIKIILVSSVWGIRDRHHRILYSSSLSQNTLAAPSMEVTFAEPLLYHYLHYRSVIIPFLLISFSTVFDLTNRHQRWPLGYGCEITYWWGTSKISKTVKCLAK